VLVTGGAGFIGSHLVDGLLAAGAGRVHVVDDLSLGSETNLDAALDDGRVTLTQGDCAKLSALSEGWADPFDYCFHLAVIPLPHSLIEPALNIEQNLAMTTAVCELGRAGGFRRLISFSSSEVYGTAQVSPMSELHPLGAHTPYAASKAASDLVVNSYATTFGLETVIVRPFNTYGERQNAGAYAGLIPAVVRAVLAGRPVEVHGDGEQTRDMTYISDTVAGALAAATSSHAVGVAFNLGSGVEASVNDMVQLILEALERPEHPVRHVSPRPGDVRRLVADTARARSTFGFATETPLAAGLQRTVDWYLRSGAIDDIRATTS
jgi:UDP-glucose 4-epimerase